MKQSLSTDSRFKNLKIAITGAKGSLGQSLIDQLKKKGAYVAGLTHSEKEEIVSINRTPDEWIVWSCGKEKLLSEKLNDFDILILNHGFNPKSLFDSYSIKKTIEINSLSYLRLIQIFEDTTLKKSDNYDKRFKAKEIWVNTSEAEIQIAFSPAYEMTKRLTGEIVSLKKSNLLIDKSNSLVLKKLIIGPFKSKLNPQGVMTPDFVAKQVIKRAEENKYLIIVTPNPLTYLIMPIVEYSRILYSRFIKYIYTK